MNYGVKLGCWVMMAFLLVACNAYVDMKVNLSSLLEAKKELVEGHVYIEIPSCADYQDSRKPSEALLKVQEAIPEVFNGAEYIECYTKQMTTFAHFTIPVSLNGASNEQIKTENMIGLSSDKQSLLTVIIPKSIKNGLDKIKQENIGMNALTMNLVINLNNDTEKDYTYTVLSAYVDDSPYLQQELTLKKGKQAVILLSDVSADYALQTGQVTALNYASK